MATVINRVTYFNIGGGGRKQCSSLYMNSGGSRKTITSAYGNINGSKKQIYPYSTSTIYTWNKYNRVTTTSGGTITKTPRSTTGSNSSYYLYAGETIYWSASPDVDSNGYLYFDNVYYYNGDPYNSDKDFLNTLSKLYWAANDSNPIPPGSCWYGSQLTEAGYDSWGEYFVRPTHTVSTTPKVTTHSKGSTYYGTVTSTNRNAYPDNSYSGSYWYVFVS